VGSRRGGLPHELELAVGRDEGDGVLGLELAELDALVELAVVDHHDGLARARAVAVRVARDAACAQSQSF
jgi:hypothetical protein